jgi:hypothetical protein
MDNVSSKHKGYDIDLIIIIEKEDISLSFTEFANDIGLVILNTRGFIVEYADIVTLDDCDILDLGSSLNKCLGCHV